MRGCRLCLGVAAKNLGAPVSRFDCVRLEFRNSAEGEFLESIHKITERVEDGNGQTMVYNSKLQNLRT